MCLASRKCAVLERREEFLYNCCDMDFVRLIYDRKIFFCISEQ